MQIADCEKSWMLVMKSSLLIAVANAVLLAACQAPPPPLGSPAAAAALAALPANAMPTVLVHKRATCHCCGRWIEHLRKSGLKVIVDDREDLAAVRRELGVPEHLASCHTAEVAGYFIEGHVPADNIVRLITQRPKIRGLAVPGMPAGAPGMEGGHDQYDVLEVRVDGSVHAVQGREKRAGNHE